MGGCCGLVHGYASKVIDVAEDGCSVPVELPCDEASDILEVNCCPPKTKREAYISVVSPLEVDANQSGIRGQRGAHGKGHNMAPSAISVLM